MSSKYYILFLVLLVGVLVYQVLIPLYNGVGSSLYQPPRGYVQLKQDKANYTASLQEADNIVKQANELKKKYEAVDPANVDLLKSMVPDDINEVKLHSEIASLLTGAGFSSEKLSVTKKGASLMPNVGVFLVSITLEDTSYERLKTMLNILERSRRIFAIKTISVTPATKLGEIYKFELGIETYYLMNK
jgi:hypothetical protein